MPQVLGLRWRLGLKLAAACAAILASPAAFGDDKAPTGGTTGAMDAKSQKPPIYVPPPPMRGGAPMAREGAATRGFEKGKTPPAVLALSPDHIGLTGTTQPVLFWFVERDSESGIVVTLLAENVSKPLLVLEIPGPVKQGIHPVRLADHRVTLDEDVRYEWFAASAGAPEDAARGLIVFKPIPASIQAQIEANPAGAAHIYAQAGFWYDAFATASSRIDSDPRARMDRAALLAQVQLDGVADAEWEAAGAYDTE